MMFFLSRVSISVWPVSYTRRRMSIVVVWSIGHGNFQCNPGSVSAATGRPNRVTSATSPSRTTTEAAWKPIATSARVPTIARSQRWVLTELAIALHRLA